MVRSIGVSTAGGDGPGLNAAMRALGESAIRAQSWVGSARSLGICLGDTT